MEEPNWESCRKGGIWGQGSPIFFNGGRKRLEEYSVGGKAPPRRAPNHPKEPATYPLKKKETHQPLQYTCHGSAYACG